MSEGKKYIIRFGAGGVGYGLIEVVWRGYTHISMLILGGLCLCLLLRIARTRWNLSMQSLAGGTAITVVELAAGCVVNLWLGLEVWDYSTEAGQLWGQVCVRYFLLWCILSCIVIAVSRSALPGMVRGIMRRLVL